MPGENPGHARNIPGPTAASKLLKSRDLSNYREAPIPELRSAR